MTDANRIPRRFRLIGSDGKTQSGFVNTDVEVAPTRFKALSLAGGDSIRGRTKGSVGLVYRSVSGIEYALTNSHVVSPIDGTAFGASIQDSNSDKIGIVHRMTKIRSDRINTVDAGIIEVQVSAERNVIKNVPLRVAGYGTFELQRDRSYYYMTDNDSIRCRYPERVETEVAISFSPSKSAYFTNFVKLIAEKGKPKRSHSGSVLFYLFNNTPLVCGVVFAGSDGVLGVIPIKAALSALASSAAGSTGTTEDVRIAF
ncbi:MAG: hypothetical protein O3B08_12620 [Proteobacteria bacterium]|nr:hypothetical protein [Pseudomonadota bacterium]